MFGRRVGLMLNAWSRAVVREEVDWAEVAAGSLLRTAVGHWRDDADGWFAAAYERLPETARVNPLSRDFQWVESWLESIGGEPIDWFCGVGSAWTLPFERGKAEGEVRSLLAALHETGRLTRQEAVSMLPVLALDVQSGQTVLDMCASPGSKTTQIAEHLGDSGVVVANEVVRGRVNMLVSNVQRHRSKTVVIVNHDARHLPNVPETGYDRILVDVPCTGTGTTRKNPDVWSRWKPNGGRSMQKLQIDILARAAKIVKPGGRIVYSTCSLDPIENEAVVAAVMAEYSDLRLLPAAGTVPRIVASAGFTDWPILDDDCSILEGAEVRESFAPPSDARIVSQLPNCMRVWNDQSGGGGFFLAILEMAADAAPKSEQNQFETIPETDAPKDNDAAPRPLDEADTATLEAAWGRLPQNLWRRGKKILVSTPEAASIWASERNHKGSRARIPGGRWRPLRVIHLGLETAHLRRGEFERVVGAAADRLAPTIERGVTEISAETLDSLLSGEEPPPHEIAPDLAEVRGNHLLLDASDGTAIPVWLGGRTSLMLRAQERTVLAARRGVVIRTKDEEE